VFKRRDCAERLTVYVDDMPCEACHGDTVAALLLASESIVHRLSIVSGSPRAPWCMMGVCFECLVEIDGKPYQQACLVPVRPGMRIRRHSFVQEEAWA
jgi:D-hydroxyproline dehydrogenase subunit gamma